MPLQLLPKTWKNLYYPPERGEYTYFAFKDKYPFPVPGNKTNRYAATADDLLTYVKAAWAADAAMLAYGRWGQSLMPAQEFDDILRQAGLPVCNRIGDWNPGSRGTQGYFACNPQFAIVAFRGTERDDPKDLMTDASALLVDESDYCTAAAEPHAALRHLSFIGELFHPTPCRVHHGFQCGLNQIWEDVHRSVSDYRSRYPNSEICFTGHSLGAALATLAISRFGGLNASLYTFGCPRVGTEAFYKRVQTNTDLGTYPFVNGNDPVTHVPIQDRWYSTTMCPLYHIDSQGTIRKRNEQPRGDWAVLAECLTALPAAGLFTVLSSPAPADLVDHSPSQYCIRLWNHVEANVP